MVAHFQDVAFEGDLVEKKDALGDVICVGREKSCNVSVTQAHDDAISVDMLRWPLRVQEVELHP